jgi:uncharacterized phiE125 gp8 family phage protein
MTLLFHEHHHRQHGLRGLKVLAPPTLEPVTLDDVRAQIGITDAADTASDAIITRRITEAREYAENYTHIAICKQTTEIRLDYFPGNTGHNMIELPRPQVIDVISVKYIDNAGTEQTIDPADYVVDDYDDLATIRCAYNVTWPDTRDEKAAVRVQYTSGYGYTALEAAKTVTAFTNASPGVASCTGHGYTDGDIVRLTATGMTEVDGQFYRIYAKATDTFQLANLSNDGGLSTAGYGTFTAGTCQKVSLDIPKQLLEAIMLTVGHWLNFQNQAENGVTVSRIPYAVRDMLDQYKVVRFG